MGGGVSGMVYSLALSSFMCSPEYLTTLPVKSLRMTSMDSMRMRNRVGASGQYSPTMCSLSASPAPRPSQKRPGYIASSVAAACAIMAGWYLNPGGVTPVPKRKAVVAPRAPSQLHTKPLWPCSGVQGWEWSEAISDVNPFSSATLLQRKRSVGWNCSNIAAYPTVPVVSMRLLRRQLSVSYRLSAVSYQHFCVDRNFTSS